MTKPSFTRYSLCRVPGFLYSYLVTWLYALQLEFIPLNIACPSLSDLDSFWIIPKSCEPLAFVNSIFDQPLSACDMSNNPSKANIFYSLPPDKIIKPPEFPPRPDLFDEVQWAPYISPENAKLARQLWELPDSILGSVTSRNGRFHPRPATAMDALAYNVYEHLMQQHMIPPSQDDWEQRWRDTTLHNKTWSVEEIFNPAKGLHAQYSDGPILVQGHGVLSAPYWTVARLKAELHSRGLDASGRSADLRRRLHDHERRSRGHTFLPKSDLSHWGVNRNDNFTFKLSVTNALKPLDMYTWAIMLSPYNPAYWLSRAYCYYLQAFFDLAIGDAYRAQLLCEVLNDVRQRNRQPGLYLRIWNAIEQHILADARNDNDSTKWETETLRGVNGINSFVATIRRALHNIISLSLAALGSWKDYKVMEHYLPERVIFKNDRDASVFERRKRVLKDTAIEYRDKRSKERLFYHEENAGNVNGGKEYPYEANDKDRTTNVSLELINNNAFRDYPKCKVRASDEDDSLFVVATEDIEQKTLIFAEEPSIRAHLGVTRLAEDQVPYESKPRCENCRRPINAAVLARYDSESLAIKNGTHPEACPCHLLEAKEHMYFCPADPQQGTTCLQIAQKLYHYRACGKNWDWLHDAMRARITPWKLFHHYPGLDDYLKQHLNNYLDFFTHTNEKHGTALSLLLREVFDITLMRRMQTGDANLMAHEIDELAMLEDPKSWSNSWFPFTFAANIRVPFDILLQLGVDIFSDLTFDTWVIQTVLRKLIINAVPWDEKWRGTAERVKREGLDKHGELPSTAEQRAMIEQKKSFDVFDSDFQTLYVFSGFSLFNHACNYRGHNANWGYDKEVPNRILVWAAEDIPKGTEIRIPYKFRPMSSMSARRILGKDCQCPRCCDGYDSSEEDDDSDDEHYDQNNGQNYSQNYAQDYDEDYDQNYTMDYALNCARHYAHNYNHHNDSPPYGPPEEREGDTESLLTEELEHLERSNTSARILREGSGPNGPPSVNQLLSNPYEPERPRSSQISPITEQAQQAENIQFVESSPRQQSSESQSSQQSSPSGPSDSARAMFPPPRPRAQLRQTHPRPLPPGLKTKITCPNRLSQEWQAAYYASMSKSASGIRAKNSNILTRSNMRNLMANTPSSPRVSSSLSRSGSDSNPDPYRYPPHDPSRDHNRDRDSDPHADHGQGQGQHQDRYTEYQYQDQSQDYGQDQGRDQDQNQSQNQDQDQSQSQNQGQKRGENQSQTESQSQDQDRNQAVTQTQDHRETQSRKRKDPSVINRFAKLLRRY